MSVKIMSLVWERAPYTAGSLLVLLALADWSNDEGICWPSVPTIAGKTRLERRSIQYIIRQLKKDDLLDIEEGRGRGRQHRYTIKVQNLRLLPNLLKGEIDDVEKAQLDTEKVQSTTEKVQPIAPDPSEEPLAIKPSLEPPYSGEDFLTSLESFRKHRQVMKKPLTREAEHLLLKKLSTWGESVATQALQDSVINRWQGVFEPRNGNGTNSKYINENRNSGSDFVFQPKSKVC